MSSVGGIVLITVGVIFTGLFTFLGFGGVDIVIHGAIGMVIQLKEGTGTWVKWTTIPIPIYMKFRLFNITNPDEMGEGEKAHLVEMGPYVYLEDWEKVNITVNEEDDMIRYTQTKTFKFMPDMSNGKETDIVTFINVIFIAVASASAEMAEDDFMLTGLDKMLKGKGEKLTRQATVKEIIFDGFSVQPYIDMINDDLVQAAAEAAGRELKVPKAIADGRFGIFKNKNGSGEGYFVARSGRNNGQDIGKVLSWEGKTVMDNWRGKPEDGCNQINGTDGTIQPPFLTRDRKVQVFNPQVCRTLTFEYVQDSEVAGISTYQFQLSPSLFEPPSKHPENWCFCPVMKNETGSCTRTGLLDLRSCVGAPLLISRPHFLDADEWVQSGVEGLNPDSEKHRMILEYHPLTSATIVGLVRLQFNIELTPYEAMSTFADARNAIIPIFWIEEFVAMDDETRGKLGLLDKIRGGFAYARVVPILVGLLMIADGVFLMVKGKKMSSAQVKSLDKNQNKGYERSY